MLQMKVVDLNEIYILYCVIISCMKCCFSTVTNQSPIHEEIKNILNSGNACCHSVQYLLSFHLLPGNLKTEIYKTRLLPVVLCGCEIWTVTIF
jgi:hypothetical protein